MGVGVGVGMGVGVDAGEDVGVAEEGGLAVEVTTDVGLTTGTFTPLFQAVFFPDLRQVYLLAPTIAVLPTFLHARPGLTAASAGRKFNVIKSTIAKTPAIRVFMVKA